MIFILFVGKLSLFIMFDGIWSEVRKMFRKSSYLDNFFVIFVDFFRFFVYRLREV